MAQQQQKSHYYIQKIQIPPFSFNVTQDLPKVLSGEVWDPVCKITQLLQRTGSCEPVPRTLSLEMLGGRGGESDAALDLLYPLGWLL
jgi:hypothetical protein